MIVARENAPEKSNKICNFLHSENDIYSRMEKRVVTCALAALILSGGFAFAQDTSRPATHKKIRTTSHPPAVTVQNDSVRVIVGENEIIIETPFR